MSFLAPEQILKQLHIKEGARIADFGAGAGHLALLLAKKVGSDGRIYAIDVQKELLGRLHNDAKSMKLTNIDTLWLDLESHKGTGLKEKSMDIVMLANILFQINDKRVLIREAKRILKSGGQALVVDWSDSFDNTGPRPEMLASPSSVEKLFTEEGFVLSRVIEAGSHHYGRIFVLPV